MPPLVRILLVDDFEPFRRFVRSALPPSMEFKIVGEAVDGLEAVQKAKDLQPDLVLIDIGLPKLSGIAAAEQIRVLAPHAKLLFISLEPSSATVREAFRVGAQGYIYKLQADSDLVPAIEAVLAGKQFVSSELQFDGSAKTHRRHEVQFYSDDMVLLDSGARFVASTLRADGAAIVIATKSHGERIIQRLKEDAFDVDGAIQQGTYVSIDAAEAFSTFMVNGVPDHDRLLEIFGTLIESCTKATKNEGSRVAVFGEGLGLLCAQGKFDAAIDIEKIWNDLLETHDVNTLCAYPLSAFHRVDTEVAFKSICAEHTAVFSR